MNEEGIGYPIYRMNEIHNSICDLDVKKYANITPQELAIFKLQDGDVLFNRTNSFEWVGRTGIYYKSTEQDEKVFASYLVRLIPDAEQVLPEYLTAFLNTTYGVRQIKARARQSINQTNVNPEEVKEIEIPLLSEKLQKAIQSNYRSAHENLVAAQEAYKLAEDMLNSSLGIADFADESCSIKTLSDSFMQSGRLDAEYYQHKYDYIKEIINCYPSKSLKELAVVNTGEFVEEKFYCDNGIDYIRGSDITDSVVDNSTAVKVNIDINDFKKISYGDLAFAMIGSVGNISIYKSNTVGLVSNNLGTISPFDKNLSNYILLFLTSNIGQMFFEKFQTRTAQPKIRKEDVENFSIPLLDDEIVKNLSDKLDESFRLRKEAKRLLDNAIKAVEMAIETDEETALKWLGEL